MSNKILCGVVVDEKDYSDFASKKYDVPGAAEINPYKWKDGKLSLQQIEFFAGLKDYRQEYPEFTKECQKIIEQSKREISQFYAARDGRKGYKVMKHNNFEDYLKDLQEVQKKASEERQSLQSNFNKARNAWNETQKDKTLSEYGVTAAKMKWLDAEKEYKEAVTDLQRRTKEDIAAIRKEFDEHIDDFYSVNGDRMDEGTIRLLNSGLKLTDKEIDRLVSQNVGNPTMLRLISDHCEKNKLNNKAARIYGSRAKAAGSHEIRIFNQVVDMVEKATSSNDLTADVWSVNKGHFERLSNEAIGNMAEIVVKPGAGEQSEI